ncbi:MAG: hypothetical protein H0U27_00535 [Nitrosopumilus sp.]|nr:hypothetical protein [Nitrosopumilus sp.]
MKKFATLVLLFGIFISAGFSQSPDTISIDKNSYMYQGNKITLKELSNITKSNPQAHKEIKMARSNAAGAQMFGSIGGFMIGWPLGAAIGGGDPNWALAGIGFGVAFISIPFALKANKHAKNAVGIYNRDLNTTGKINNYNYNIFFSGNGIGLRVIY